jgi:predicted CXXCH cytochrome family protein
VSGRAALTVLLALTLLLAACAGVLGIRPTPAHPFEHRAHVLKGVNCRECHGDVGTAGETGPVHFPETADCLRCHKAPHDARACGGCHGEPHVRGSAELAREHLRFEHRQHMARVTGDCVRCHQEVAVERPQALRPSMAVCFSCHEHQAEWQVRRCEGCHVDLPAELTMPQSHLVHEGDFVREHGVRAAAARDLCMTCHSERSCASCHGAGTAPILPARLAFDKPSLSGLHRAGFRSRHADEARAAPGLCTTCHSERQCQGCHTDSHVSPGSGARTPHPAGWLTTRRGGGEHGLQARVDPISCASCHGGAGEQLCVGCHQVGGPGGNPHGSNFSSNKDKMRDVPCRACHGALR